MKYLLMTLAAAGLLLLALAALLLWNFLSPVPAIRLMRRGKDAPPEFPADFSHRQRRVAVHRDLVYPSSTGRNRVDLYLPKDAPLPCPVILWAHGGAFVAGNKEGLENWATCLASEGVAVAAVEYQWAPEAHWPAQVAQIGDCCRYLMGAAGSYGLDMDRVVVAGDSAGAHMAAQFALIHTSERFRATSGLSPVLPEGALRAALLYCGPYDIGRMAHIENRALRFFMGRIGWSYLGEKHWQGSRQAALTVIRDFVTGDFPPAYITDGNTFSFEPQGRDLAAALERVGAAVETRFFSREEGQVNHEYQFAMAQPNAWLCYEDTISFLKKRNLL